MIRKEVTLEVRSEDISLEEFTSEEKENLLSLVKGDPLLLNFYVLRELMRIRKRLGLPEWTQKYEYRLDTGKTNLLIDQFPSQARFLYVHTASGTVNLRFDSQNEPSWSLSSRDQFRMHFDQIYLSWTAQATKKLIFYVSNREILMSTLS